MNAAETKSFLDKIPRRQFVPMLAFVLVMAILGGLSYVCLFNHAEARLPKEPLQVIRWLDWMYFLVGLISVAVLLWSVLRFYREFSRPEQTFDEILDTAPLPIYVAKKKPLVITFANSNAVAFFHVTGKAELHGKAPKEADKFLLNADYFTPDSYAKWRAVHERRETEAEHGVLESTSPIMHLEKSNLMAKDWRLTTTPIVIDGEPYYLTVFSPEEEIFEAAPARV